MSYVLVVGALKSIFIEKYQLKCFVSFIAVP